MKRQDVRKERKWSIEDIYATDEEWEMDFEKAKQKLDFSKFAGKLGNKETLLEFLKYNDEVSCLAEKTGVYAIMRRDEDSSNSKYTSYAAKVSSLYSSYAVELAFYEPEMAKLDESYLKEVIADARFSDYDYQLKRILKSRPHVISEQEEKLVGMAGEIFDMFSDVFGMIDNVNLPLPEIEWEGKKLKLSHGMYGIIMHADNREKRAEAYKKYYAAYISLIDTVTTAYYGNVKKDVFLSKVYKHPSCLEHALFSEDVDRKVYYNLIKAVDKSLPDMHRYISDRKKLLGYDKLYFYDIYAPLVEGVNVNLDYDEAYDYVVRGLIPLGKEYCDLLRRGYNERWLDVEETEGKRSGAYSTGFKGISHPYVLLNYKPNINNVFTIAHEMGHSLHTYFSCKNQPYAKSDYKIFVAEVASTVNEVLLLKFMLNDAKDTELKKYLLNYYLDTIRTTLHRQTMFAEFEYEAHTMAEKGEPLTKENLCATYAGINKKYYGEDIEHDYEISCEWMRIPHFYRAFYVYKYATGITAAINIAKRILTQGESAVCDYFKFLSSGSSSDPVSLLKLAGVDLSTEQPFITAMDEFKETLIEFEKLTGI